MGNHSDKFLRIKAVNDLTGLGRTRIYRLIGEGRFPRPVRLGPQSVAWLQSEVEAWMQERISERDQVV